MIYPFVEDMATFVKPFRLRLYYFSELLSMSVGKCIADWRKLTLKGNLQELKFIGFHDIDVQKRF